MPCLESSAAHSHVSGVPRRLVDKAGEESTADLVKRVENCINHDWDEAIRKRGSRACRDMTMVRGRNNVPQRCHQRGKAGSICNALKREPPTQPQSNHPETRTTRQDSRLQHPSPWSSYLAPAITIGRKLSVKRFSGLCSYDFV
jgi:hypothetical protein